MDAVAEAKMDAKDFFAQLSKGRKVVERTIDGEEIELTLRFPSMLEAEQVYDIIAGLRYDSDLELERNRLIQLACCICIEGVTFENVIAFPSRFPPMPKVVLECLRLLQIGDDDLQRLKIDTRHLSGISELAKQKV